MLISLPLAISNVNLDNSAVWGGVMVRTGIIYGQRTQLHFIDANLNAHFLKGLCDQQMHICIPKSCEIHRLGPNEFI
jgi:hypothetical protein